MCGRGVGSLLPVPTGENLSTRGRPKVGPNGQRRRYRRLATSIVGDYGVVGTANRGVCLPGRPVERITSIVRCRGGWSSGDRIVRWQPRNGSVELLARLASDCRFGCGYGEPPGADRIAGTAVGSSRCLQRVFGVDGLSWCHLTAA